MKTLLLTFLIVINAALLSQVAVSTGSYFQDFGTTDITSWSNNVTFPGWYEVGTFQSHVNITTAAPSNTGGFYTYECNGNNDQKIGSRASGGSGTLKYGVVLQNTTGNTISNVKVAYKGYQLSLAQNGNTNVIAFDYIVSASPPAISAGGGTGVAALNFTQLQSSGSSGSAQISGYPCTQMANISGCITVNIPNNSYILLRWSDVDDAGNDHHMAVDDIDVEFIATNLTVNSPVICASQATILTVTGAANYTWTPSTALTATTGSAVTANPSGTIVYTISASAGSCPPKTITSTVTVVSNPSVTVNSETICSSGSATLTATGATTYTWSPATGLSSTTGNTVIANPGNTLIYTVTGSSGACPITPGTSTVTVLTSPVLTPVGSQTICSNSSVTLTTAGAGTYTWSPGTGLSSTNGNMVTASPANTTVYALKGSNGVCAAVPVTFTVTVITTPTLSVNSVTVCAGTPAVLTAAGATGYIWSNPATLSSGTGSSVNAIPAGTTVYTVNGSIASCSATPVTTTVTVISNPSITVNSASICTSGSAVLTASGAGSYTWVPSGTLSSGAGTTVTSNPAITTIYTLTGSLGSCPVTPATATVTVLPTPVITVNSATICSSNSTILTATGATSYTWNSTAGLFSSSGNTVTANPASTIVYTLTGSMGGCPATPVTATVTVINSPTLSVNSGSICASGSIVLIASGASGYSWSPAEGLNVTTGNAVTANPGTTTVYTVTGSVNTCSANAISTVTVMPVQSAGFNYAASYCKNAPNATPGITGVSGGTFNVLPGNLVIDHLTGSVTLSSATQTTYTVSYNTSGACADMQTFVITIIPVPNVTTGSLLSICAGTTAVLNATADIPGGTYSWMPGNITGNSVSVSPSASMVYTVTYVLNGCAAFQTFPVTVNSLPLATAISSAGSSNTEGEDVTLTASGDGTYLWNNGSTHSTIKVQPNETGSYCVTVTNNFGCQSTACVTVNVDSQSTLYVPNVFTPNGDGLNDIFSIPHSNIHQFNIKIFNRWGEKLFESDDIEKSWDGSFSGKEVADGVYVYVILAKGMDKTNYEKRGHVTVLH